MCSLQISQFQIQIVLETFSQASFCFPYLDLYPCLRTLTHTRTLLKAKLKSERILFPSLLFFFFSPSFLPPLRLSVDRLLFFPSNANKVWNQVHMVPFSGVTRPLAQSRHNLCCGDPVTFLYYIGFIGKLLPTYWTVGPKTSAVYNVKGGRKGRFWGGGAWTPDICETAVFTISSFKTEFMVLYYGSGWIGWINIK